MENKQFRLKRIKSQIRRLIPVVFLMMSVLLMVLWQTKNPIVVSVRHTITERMVPVISVLSAPVKWGKSVRETLSNIVFLYARNKELEKENAMLRQWQALAIQLETEQNEIKKLINYVPYPKSSAIVARLIMDTGDKFSRSYVALAGANEGIEKGAVAMTDKGLFARVIEVGKHGSRLMMLTDYLSRVPVIIGKNRISGVLSGDNSRHPKIIFTDTVQKIQIGDIILTSGYMGVYPSGLRIGVIRSVSDKEIDVDLFEDGEGLEFVRLIDFGLSDVLLKSECQEP